MQTSNTSGLSRLSIMLSGLAVLITFGAPISRAQDVRGRIQGFVTDSSQAVVQGAKVIATNDQTGVADVRESDATGHYLFDFVNPGRYTITVEHPGFSKFVQQNVEVVVRGDTTVNILLKPGAVAETVTVTEAPPLLQFNTSTMDQVVDQKMLDSLPVLARNPFSLATLDPSVRTPYAANVLLPFNKWQTASFDVGGAPGSQNDLLLDGAPIQVANAGSYVPSMDSVQEFSVQQNGVDAEFGHSGGGIMNLSMKSGTNEVHGTAYYFGRNPALNARVNSVSNTKNLTRNHIWGGTLGGPIIKDKLFTFGSYEQWRMTENNNAQFTLPTALERTGDFSQSLNNQGSLRTIYDPFSTQFDPATGAVSRTPFPGNQIPQDRMDPVALKMLKDIWLPNNAGIDLAGTNNFRLGWPRYFRYWNFSDRTDWNVTDRFKVFGRFSRFTHNRDPQNYANSPAAPINGYDTQSRNYAGDIIYTVTPSTVLNVRAGYAMLIDDLRAASTEIGEQGLTGFWPNQWFEPYLKDVPIVFYPSLNFNGGFGTTSIGRSSSWREHAHTYTYSARLSSQKGRHYLKTGFESRRTTSSPYYPNTMKFNFNAAMTANTFITPKTNLAGDPYATFLLGALDGDSTAYYTPLPEVYLTYYAGYVQDDFKLNRNITLNLGLRYEYTGAMREAEDRLSRYLDLTNPIPEMQAAPPQFPGAVSQYGAPHVFNGAWVYTDDAHPAAYKTPKNMFLPRIGIAARINDKTAFRAGYARYAAPIETISTTIGQLNLYGFDASTNTAPSLEGQPGALLSDPFPASNPLILPVGKAYGRYTNLGGNASWYQQNPIAQGVNDRFNVSIQRQLPGQLALDVTYFWNIGSNFGYSRAMNLMDPQLLYTNKAALSQSVDNPFYHYLTPDKFPGQLRNQAKVSIQSLLRPYPQYGSLEQDATDGTSERYQSVQIRVQRRFSSGISFMGAYNYSREKSEEFFNDLDEFAGRFTYLDSNQNRHRLVAAGSYELPFGKGRPYLASANPVINGILGGWTISSVAVVNSGAFLRFGQVQENGAPEVFRNRDHWFDTSGFDQAIPFTPRTNPYQYAGVTGPRLWNIDAALAKAFDLSERFRLEFRMDAYNLTNTFVGTAPNTNPTSSTFGRITNQSNQGREMQYTLRLRF